MNNENKSLWKKARGACGKIIASVTGRAIFEVIKWAGGALSVSALGFLGLSSWIYAAWHVQVITLSFWPR